MVVGVLLSAAATTTACGDETPARAIYALAHELEHDDFDGACERLYPGTRLRAEAQQALGLKPGARDGDWAPDARSCQRAFAGGGPLADFEFVEPRVRTFSSRSLNGSGEIAAIATAQVALDGRAPIPVRLVFVDDRWRVVPAR